MVLRFKLWAFWSKACSLDASFCFTKEQEKNNTSSKTVFTVRIQGENEEKIIHIFNSNMKVDPSVPLGKLPRLLFLLHDCFFPSFGISLLLNDGSTFNIFLLVKEGKRKYWASSLLFSYSYWNIFRNKACKTVLQKGLLGISK